ncbi:colicin I receptor precursor [Photobacterium aphoticum]|uniref:Colicin I receptor n=1 Tax=Photobacterium aphoticum TaxID=754436 RepID=A0A090QMC0_9GAMM|nr:colicin I receptor precursor [Photobacterium aphoticum]
MSTTQPFVSPAVLLPTLLSSAILAVFSSSAWASSEKPSEERPSQVVHDDTPVQALDRMVVTATLTEHSELTAPASVSVITAEDIAKMPVKDLSEAIRSSTGVNIEGSTAYGRNSIRIRGLDGKHTLLLINGRRINSQDALIRGNDFDLATIPLTAISRIEVVRGPVSSLYGSEAMGGVVNVILKRLRKLVRLSRGGI